MTTFAVKKSREKTATDIYSSEDSSLHSDPEYQNRAKFSVTVTTSRPLVDGEYVAFACISVSKDEIKKGQKGVAGGI